jgi:ABC-type Na+ efflux pump permease subunit
MSFVAGCLNVTAMTFTMRSTLLPLGKGGAGLSFEIPLASIPVLIAGAALLALFVSAGMMILAAFARTFKEGQSLVSPFLAAFMLPVTFIQGPAQEFTTGMAFIPVINVAMMFRQAIAGVYTWPLIAITVTVELVCIVAALKLATTIIEYEDFVMGSYSGTFAQFIRHRLLRRTSTGARRPIAS